MTGYDPVGVDRPGVVMSSTGLAGGATAAPTFAAARRPVLTFLACAVTLEVSLAAIFSPALMDLFVRDLPQLRAGQ